MPKIDPELWVLVHGGTDPEAVADWPFRARWAWFVAMVDWIADYATDEEGWANHAENNWNRVEALQAQGWPPSPKILHRAARVIEHYLEEELWSDVVGGFQGVAEQWERCFARGREDVVHMHWLWKALQEARDEPIDDGGVFTEKLVTRLVRYDALGGVDV